MNNSASRKFFYSFPLALAVLETIISPCRVIAQATLTVDPSTRYQVVHGWEGVTFASQEDPAFAQFKDELFERVINEAGINRLRVEVRSGAENRTDYFTQYQNGQIDYATWRANRYATVNDNADPNTINAAGFHFTELDRNIRTTVLPLRALAAAKDQPLYINLNYVAFTGQISQGGTYHHANAAEYAEFILAVFLHMDQEFGFVPDAVEILLEPDNVSQWNGAAVGRAIVAVAARLSAAGYTPEIIAPSCTNMGNAVSYFDALAGVPGALAALDEICYHRYGGVSDANLKALASRAQQHGKRASMLEWWSTGNSIDILLKDLTMGRNAAWQQGTLAGLGNVNEDMALYMVDVTNPAAPAVRVNRKTRLLRQVYRFVRRGAVRVAASSTSGIVQPVAFVNADGGHVLVARATASSSFKINGLPPGTYGINYSTAAEFNVNRPDQTIAPGETISATIPAPGALTVYQLRPTLSSAIRSDGTFQLSIGSLKPGFMGTIERNTNVADPGDWREAGTIPASDYRSAWSELLGASTFFRFQQK